MSRFWRAHATHSLIDSVVHANDGRHVSFHRLVTLPFHRVEKHLLRRILPILASFRLVPWSHLGRLGDARRAAFLTGGLCACKHGRTLSVCKEGQLHAHDDAGMAVTCAVAPPTDVREQWNAARTVGRGESWFGDGI